MVEAVVERSHKKETMLSANLFKNIYKPAEAADDTIFHYVQPHDTLAGLAVKYGSWLILLPFLPFNSSSCSLHIRCLGCRKDEIARLNRLTSDMALFGKVTVLVPRPPNYSPQSALKPCSRARKHSTRWL